VQTPSSAREPGPTAAKAEVRRRRPGLTFRRTASRSATAAADLGAAERLLARLVARAYVAEHPELLLQRHAPSGPPEATGHGAAGSAMTGDTDFAGVSAGGLPRPQAAETPATCKEGSEDGRQNSGRQ